MIDSLYQYHVGHRPLSKVYLLYTFRRFDSWLSYRLLVIWLSIILTFSGGVWDRIRYLLNTMLLR
jgi:hypothetical protein